MSPPKPAPTATAVLVQPNLDVSGVERLDGPRRMGPPYRRIHAAGRRELQIAPTTGLHRTEFRRPARLKARLSARLIPRIPIWWSGRSRPRLSSRRTPRFQQALAPSPAKSRRRWWWAISARISRRRAVGWRDYNSALVVGADGARVGRYDKIHLVPFGEYIPFQGLLFFAHKLTGRVSAFTRGERAQGLPAEWATATASSSAMSRSLPTRCASFAQLGAEVLVNISDDGWYGDTSAPWQHLNMARMRAIENRRWLLRDTNNGVTAVIDPYGRVRQSIPRHQTDALPARYAFRDDITFYTAHGDVFAWLCAILSLGVVGWALLVSPRRKVQSKVRS